MSLPLATVATQFLDRPNLAKSTVLSYEIALLPLLKKYGSLSIETLDRQTLEEYLQSLSQLAKSTRHRHRTIIQALFNFAVDCGHVQANPIAKSDRRKCYSRIGSRTDDRQIRWLTPSQLELLYRALGIDCRMQTLVRLLHGTGATVAEVLALDLAEVDLKRRRFQTGGGGNKQRWCCFTEDVAIWLNKFLRFYRHPHPEALFTAQHPVTAKVTRLTYRRVHQLWRALTQQHSEPARSPDQSRGKHQ